MNYYFLVEDYKSLTCFLPKWLEYMDFDCVRVQNYQSLTNNSYVLESSQGVSKLENDVIFRTIDTILTNKNHVDKLVVIVDAEDVGVENRKARILSAIHKTYTSKGVIIPCDIRIFVCNRCVETWLLGCYGLYPSDLNDISTTLVSHCNFYDIEHFDPEYMTKPPEYNKTVASYHFQYLHDLTLDISKKYHLKNFTYRKAATGCASRQDFFNSMLLRISKTPDIPTFKEFYDFIISERENNK